MEQKGTATLLELAAKSLLSNEPAAIHALEELPRDLFVPLFGAAFLGGHTKVLKELVRVWPFCCLHIRTSFREKSYYEILEAMIDGLQILPAQNPSARRPKLRILDLRQDLECETTCSEFQKRTPSCSESCIYSQHSILKMKEARQHNVQGLGIVHSESEPQSAWEPVELLVDISISGTLRKNQFLSFLQRKVEQSFGSLHLCCRGLQIDNMSSDRSILRLVDMGCTDYLEVKNADLSEVTTLVSEMIHLTSLSLFNIPTKSCKGRKFRNFLTGLERLDNLQDISLSSFYLKNQLQKLLRVLPPDMDTFYLSSCGLSNRDVTALSQSPQATHIMLLDLSNNEIVSEDYGPFQTLLENVSGTLQHLEVNNCQITDSALSAVLPALSRCTRLRVLSFVHNPITMAMLISLLQQLTS
ncbi:melanoma antigen preferentially expressed in tumors-like isoform X1 [Pteropus medius]|uniref:melanoma antigen preferentially expressed in tumors-like isoform X1 n=1 Tax=Pteropus vampyrus TaxID=132908 RepID=UPI00196B1F9D|nr:melanoma antigen preferentially expressed in tumors-like isoform X1 [Pteropus giganteus]XP_039730794.1 melanoma antigen preferentially expressed in tumors-like isoform X1 [Pteropus giganteus]XP_039730795.1 melanoma antigen preferentially expressed in tumors-like isoform X1 [Pteropus giganteus]